MLDLLPKQLPILHAGEEGEVTLSKHAVASLLAGAFFCILPPQMYEKEAIPTCSFAGLYEANMRIGGFPDYQAHKIRCHLNYFRRVTTESASAAPPPRRRCPHRVISRSSQGKHFIY